MLPRSLVGPPLGQALVVLWLAGLGHLLAWPVAGRPVAELGGAALLGALLTTLMAARLRRPMVLALAVALGLLGLLSVADRLGARDPLDLATGACLYALGLWWLGTRALASPLAGRIAALLDVAGGHGRRGGRAAAGAVAHWSALAVAGLALAAHAASTATAGVAPAALPALAPAVLLVALAGWRYRLASHTYLLVALGLWGVVTLYAGPSGMALDDPTLGLLAAAYALLARAVAAPAAGRLAVGASEIYRAPIERSAAVLAGLAGTQALVLGAAASLAPPGWTAAGALALAALTLALPRSGGPQPIPAGVLGLLLAVVAASWAYSAGAHGSLPFGLWPGGPAPGDAWLVLAALALALAAAATLAARIPGQGQALARAAHASATLVYLWALGGVLARLADGGHAYLPGALALLTLALFPLLRPAVDLGPRLRGLGSGLLLTLMLVALLGPTPLGAAAPLAIGWGYALWAGAVTLLPRFNRAAPGWAVAPGSWPWLGLAAVASGVLAAPQALLDWPRVLAVAGYLFLMLRVSSWPGFPWLAVGALTGAGVALGLRPLLEAPSLSLESAGLLAIETLAWANVLLAGLRVWDRHGAAIAARLGLPGADLGRPLATCALGIAGLWLALLAAWQAVLAVLAPQAPSGLLVAGLLTVTWLHGLRLRPSSGVAHAVILAALCAVLAAWSAIRPFELALALALWAALLVALPAAAAHARTGPTIAPALEPWRALSPAAALAALALAPSAPLWEHLLTVAVVAATTATLGWQRLDRRWLYAAAGLALTLAHGLWLLWLPIDRAGAALPWVALELALVAALLRWLEGRRRPDAASAPATALLAEVLPRTLGWAAGLALAEWTLHALLYAGALAAQREPPALLGRWDAGAALAAIAVLLALGVRVARRQEQGAWVYGVAFLAGLAGLYGRLLVVGLAPPGVWDTAALLAASFGLLALQRVSGSRPVLHLVLLLPVLALLTVPYQLGSAHAALSLVAAATLYLLTRRATGLTTPLYLAVLALNAAIYLWVPDWATRAGLVQLYVIPAALTVLLLLHLHRRELKPSVLNATRLAALATLYAAATADVFLRPDLAVFALALALGLIGAGLGIALRTRAFLYAGVAFLVVNVLGQLVQLYPEQRLARAVLLMVLGATVTAAMIGFSVKREAVLARVRLVRADLAGWQ